MEIINIKINDLKPYENNPRNNESAIEDVIHSISNYGFRIPLVVDKDYVIICGHTRYEASKRIGLKELPCVIADDLSEEQIKAFRLVDNKTHEYSMWDTEKLFEELDLIGDYFTGMNFKENFDIGSELLEELNKDEPEEETIIEDEKKIYTVRFIINDINEANEIYNRLREELTNCEVNKLW